MKRILSLLGVAIVSVILLPTVGVQASSISPAPSRLPMRVTILPSSGPHTLTRKRLVALHLSVKGLVLDARNIGKKAKPGHGHIQVYFDRIPSDAYRIADLRGMVAISGGELFTVDLSQGVAKGRHGKHKLIVALARNDYVLYRAPTASFSLSIK